MAKFVHSSFTKKDNYMTPHTVWKSIEHLIPKDKVIWEPFYGNGDSGSFLQSLGFQVIHDPNMDFFKHNEGDIIVTNPPFSIKKEVFTRLAELDKPFIVISPLNCITTNYIRSFFKTSIQMIIPTQRIRFLELLEDGSTSVSKGKPNFDSAFFCYKINLSRDIWFL